jgi:two-component system, OmpR family, response regulator
MFANVRDVPGEAVRAHTSWVSQKAKETTASTISVLLIEDDERLARITARYLETHGVRVSVALDGDAGLELARRQPFDLLLLDLMLPGVDGIEICRRLRQRQDTPIVMLTARGEEADRVLGLEAGADDYIAKPFSSRELLARIRAHVRRARGHSGPSERVLRVGRLVLDTGALSAMLDGHELPLTGYEFSVLRALAERAGRVLSREQLLDLAKGSVEESFDRSIDGHISRLRNKLGDDPRHPRLLKTVRGAGYVLATADEEHVS